MQEKPFFKYFKMALWVLFGVVFVLVIALAVVSIIEWREGKATMIEVATISGVILAAFSVFYLAEQVRVSVREMKTSRSYDHIMQFNQPEFMAMAVKARNFLKNKSISSAEKQTRMNAIDGEERRCVLTLLNSFEAIGILYNRDKLDKVLIREFFMEVSTAIYNEAFEPYLMDRQKAIPGVYENWEQMNSDLKKYLVQKGKQK